MFDLDVNGRPKVAPVEMVQDGEEEGFIKQLQSLRFYNEESSWNTKKIDMFKLAVERTFVAFPWKCSVRWNDMEANAQKILVLTVSTQTFGQMVAKLIPAEINTWPKNLPQILFNNMVARFNKRIDAIKQEALGNVKPAKPELVVLPPSDAEIKREELKQQKKKEKESKAQIINVKR
jgi:hypothetical protein